MEKKTIGAFIAVLRRASGLTQKQLADKLCVSDKSVSRWERDETLPDLTLIPVIAEIFGVTSDELLRGQRANPDISPAETAPEKTEKQLRHFIAAAKTKFRIQSILCVGIACFGFIAAMICNFAFLRARLGFLLGSAFYVAALICQIIFSVLAYSRMDAEQFDPCAIAHYRRDLVRFNEIVFSCIALLLSATLPLIVHVQDAYWGLPSHTYSLLLLLYLGCSAVVCALICRIINIRLGYSTFSKKAKIRLTAVAIVLPVMGLTWLGHYFSTELLYANRYLLADNTRYDSFQAFQKAIETPMDSDGGSLILLETYPDVKIYKNTAGERFAVNYYVVHSGTVPNAKEYGYWHANRTIADYCQTGNVFYTLSPGQAETATNTYQVICIALFILYPIEAAAAAVLCHRKIKKLSENA